MFLSVNKPLFDKLFIIDFLEKMMYFSKKRGAKMTIKEQLFQKIREQKQGWAFSATDFIQDFKRGDIDVALSSLVESGDIRRVTRGIYDYPLYSAILGRRVAFDINQIAQALARKFNWEIYPDGNTALNYLGLSTQIVAKNIYLSDGPNRKYVIDKTTLEFKHIANKELSGSPDTILVVQAIRAVSEKQITPEFINNLSAKFSVSQWRKIASEASRSSAWILEVIKQALKIAEEKNNG